MAKHRAVWLASIERGRCSNEVKAQNPLNLLGCPKPANRSRPLVGRSLPHCRSIWRRYCCLTICFRLFDTCFSCEDIIARQSCAMLRRWPIFASFLRPAFSASRVQHTSDLHSKFALRPHHVSKYDRHLICDR